MDGKVVIIESIDDWNNIVRFHKNNNNLLVCKFSTSWCPPCKMLAPKFNQLSLNYNDNVMFLSIDIDKNQEIAEKFNVSSIPTTLIIQNCKVIYTVNGANIQEIQENIDSIIQ